ncbi:membrane protein insertase YidC [Sphingorhabdus lutea]|uniref:Membrane protein insertase YidC n=1 Tax=Sphingorhabdus lutea TaxID=1913578 RepID=A0A1L3JB86_9SPHN|nr:membrane protein insertase YidC [Sphingorhabdus lutea]APG62392.1 membrane protein insertase YidC [Sphingorhabdus lutea]
MEDRRNLILAIVFTGLILVGWQYAVSYFMPEAVQQNAPVAAKNSQAAPNTGGSAALPDIPTAQAAPKTNLSAEQVIATGQRVKISTPKLSGSINLRGAQVDDLLLLAHRTDLDKKSPPVRLFSPKGSKNAYYGSFSWVGTGNITLPNADTLWSANGAALTPKNPITLSWKNDKNQLFEIILSIDEDYLIKTEQRFSNFSSQPAEISPFGMLSRAELPKEKDSWNIHIGPMGVFDDVADYDWDYDDVAEAPNSRVGFESNGGWLGFTDKYWLGALIPDPKSSMQGRFQQVNGEYQTVMVRSVQSKVSPNNRVSHISYLYAGAKEVEVLDKYVDEIGVNKLDYSIDWGWFRAIEKVFFKVLHWFFGVFGNFGFAILGLTFLVRLLMFPVAQKQFASMAAMRAVQPKMKKLQERYKEDKPKMQQEIMKLYKDEKVNPLAGCLPIVLQIPIFFSLYKLLMLTIEMRHQPFMLWIKDLSAPDPLTPVNLFGLLPFDPPAMIAIGILPILLGISMWLMQKLNPQPMDDIQKQVFGLMPWFLMFIMAPFAAGLQLYWVMSNFISILQQKWLYSRHPQLKIQMAEEAEQKAKEKAEKAKAAK